jgi:DNA-binding response OmpR family regulator
MDYSKDTILVIEDEEKIVEFVESYLLHSGYKVIKSNTARKGISLFLEERVDLILLDLMLPDMKGEEVCKEIRKKSEVPIIMLTAKSGEENMINGLNMGADDYITKPFSPREMMARVNALLRRTKKDENKNILSFNEGDLCINQNDYTIVKSGKPINLTKSEYLILVTLAKRSNKAFTREELIGVAFDYDYDAYDRTIDSHIKNLRSKIENNPKEPIYVLTIRGIGYRFGGTLWET